MKEIGVEKTKKKKKKKLKFFPHSKLSMWTAAKECVERQNVTQKFLFFFPSFTHLFRRRRRRHY